MKQSLNISGAASPSGVSLGDVSVLPTETPNDFISGDGLVSKYPRNLCIHQLFEAQVECTPESIALEWPDGRMTYHQLNERANQLAHHLRTLGLMAETLVGVYVDRSPEFIVAVLGILKAGGAYVPLDTDYPPARLQFLLEDSGVPILISGQSLPKELDLPGISVVDLAVEANLIEVCAKHNPDVINTAEHLAYVIYTSGSTGQPKGVAIPHRGVVRLVRGQNYAGFDCRQRFLLLASTSFDAATFELWGSLLNGAVCVIFPKQLLDFQYLETYVRERRVTCMWLTSGLFNQIINVRPSVLETVQHVLAGGDALSVPHVQKAMKLLPALRLTNGYGPTESTTFACCHAIKPGEIFPNGSVPIGRPIAHTQCHLLDEQLMPVPVGVPAELYIGGDGLARGYWKRPELTAEKFIADPFSSEPGARLYRTGDLARYLPDGNIEFLGRLDQQVKIRGFRIELSEIESVLGQHPAIRECVLVARETQPGEKELLAYLVVQSELAPTVAELRAFLLKKLPDYMVPAVFSKLDKLPLTSNGKVDRKALPAPSENLLESGIEFVAARTPPEAALAKIWSELLRVERIGIHDNFFALGGHSLLAVRIVFRIRSALKVELPVRLISECPTIAELAVAVEQVGKTKFARLPSQPERLPRSEVSSSNQFAASFNQQQLWFIDQLEPGNSVYNLPFALRLRGHLNRTALQRSLHQLIERHEILRTTFRTESGVPVQMVTAEIALELPVVNLETSPTLEREAEAQRLMQEEAARPFDLNRGPLVRAQLLHLDVEDYVLLLTFHHIIFDGWSVEILLRELAAGYTAHCAGKRLELPELPIQFGDYAAWQHLHLTPEVVEHHLGYWRKQLAGVPTLLELPGEKSRQAAGKNQIAEQNFTLSAEAVFALGKLGQRHGVTPFVTLLAAFCTLLHRHSGQSQILIGTPFAGRTGGEVENLIGYFVNALPVKADFSSNPGFVELLHQIQEAVWSAQAHQDLPFERLVRELQPAREKHRNPFFQVFVGLEVPPAEFCQMPGLVVEFKELVPPEAMFDLTLLMTDLGNGLGCALRYNTDLLDDASVARLAGGFEKLLASILVEPSQRVSEIPILPESERQKLLVQWNQTRRDYPRQPVHTLFEIQAERTPDAVAVIFDNEQVTYRELNERAGKIARRLRQLGVGSEKLVGLFAERSLEMVVGVLGILKAGAAYVPMDPKYPQDRLAFMLEDARPAAVLTQKALLAQLPPHRGHIVLLDERDDGITAQSANLGTNQFHSQLDDLAYVIFTSGSTGRPKGVQITHRALVNFLSSMQWQPGIVPEDILLAVTTLSFDIAGLELFLPLISGARLVIASPETVADGAALVALMNRTGATFMQATPATWKLMLEAGWTGNSKLKILCGGEAWPVALADQLLPRCKSLWNMYGPTETTIWSAATQIEKGDPVLIGRPIANTTIYLLDAALQPVPIGAAGELHIGGDGLARGYLNRTELTAGKFITDPFSTAPGARLYKTGDLARYRSDGAIEYLGRMDQQVKVRGFRIELGEIESVLGRHPAVREGVVVAREDAAGEKNLVAYLVAREEQIPVVTELREFLLKSLPEYMVPVAFVILAKLPLTPNGKIDRKALPAPAENRLESGARFVEAHTSTEIVLAKIWGDLLGVERVGIHDNFFALGGHSLLAVRIAFRIRDALKTDMPVKLISEFPTIAGLAQAVEKSVKQKPVRPVQWPARKESATKFPASFSQEQLWFIDQLEPGRSVYNVPLAIRLNGLLDSAALQQSLNQLIRRHEVLRTTFPSGGVPMQCVAAELILELRVVNIESFPETAREAEVQRRLLQEAGRPFDLSCGPLLRAELFKLGDELHILLLTIHHIVFDGWSVDVLLRELAAGYATFCEGRSFELPAPPMQFADFAAWQRELLTGEVIEQHLDYWRKQLAGVPTVLELPTDKPRPLVADHCGAHQVFELPKEMTDALGELGRRQGTTIFVTMLATFQTLLHRFSGQPSLLVGSPMSGRTLKESEDLIGFFMNALPLKADFSGNPPFIELLRAAHQTVWEAQDHQELPFEKLVAELQPQRDLSRNPIFQAAFVFENESLVTQRTGSLKWESEFVRIAHVKFDLTLTLIGKNGGLRGVLEYATGIFEPETIRRLAENYLNLLADIVADPQQPVSNLKLLSAAERNRLLIGWNNTAADYPRDQTIHQLFEAQTLKTPDAVAVLCDDKQLTYRELNLRANQVAHRLRVFGIGPDTLVGIYVERSLELVVGLLGVLKAGGAYVPLDIKNPKPRLQQQLKDIKALLTKADLLAQLPAFAGVVVCFDRDRQELSRLSESNPKPVGTSENLAYVIFTSGSTGVPKGVAIRHRNLVNYTHFISRRLGLETFPNGLKFAFVSTVAADLGNTCIFPALLSGGSLNVVNEETAMNPEGFARLVSQHAIDVLKITPSHLAALLAAKNPPAVLPRRFLIFGGEALAPQLVQRIQQLRGTCRIINHYGPTETTVGSLTLGEEDFDLERLPVNANVPIGRPIANTQAYILDAQLQPVPVGLRGQLYISGDGVAAGYFNHPELTTEKFIRNPFSLDSSARLYGTGDLARYLPDGRIEFLGRLDHQVKIRGFRIELGEIEAAIKEHPEVSQCVLVAQTNDSGDPRLVAYVVPSHPPSPPAVDGWRDFLKRKLPDYMIPAAFVNLEKLPLNANGKLDRTALPAWDWSSTRTAPVNQFDLPRNPLELQMLLIWQRILKVKVISIHANFFDLGGHSLLAVQLVSEINQTLNRSLSIPAFFRSPTIEGIARTFEKDEHGNPEPKLIPLLPGDPGRSLFFLDASMGQCQLAQLLDIGLASFATIVPLSAATFQAASRNEVKNLPSVETLAAAHAALIQKHQPSGSCVLIGHSFGGLLAFEVAHQLQQQGRTVEMILLLDSWAAIPAWWRKLQVLSLARARKSIGFRLRHRWSKNHQASPEAAGQKPSDVQPALASDLSVEVANQPIGGVSWEILERVYHHARKNYQLRPLATRAIIFRAQHSEIAHYYAIDPNLGWDGLLTRGLEVVETPGDHFSLLKRPHLLMLAEHIKQRLKPSS